MNKLIKTILIISIFLPFAFAQAQVDNLVVEFQQTPLFKEANFLPGEGVSRWIKVTNNSAETHRIAVEAINKNDPDNFASQLNLIIKEGATIIFNNTLSQFFSQGETYLSSLAGNGSQTEYDFMITFNSGAGNAYQEKTLGFDIVVGFEGTEGGLPLPPPGGGTSGGGGGGGGNGPPDSLPPGLTILNEAAVETTTISVTITWQTSYPASSQVIYALESEKHTLDLSDNIGNPPKYGYERTTPETDSFLKVINHSVIISGLTPGTTYHFRAVSHASLAISYEHSFTTLTPEEAIAKAAEAAAGETISGTAGGEAAAGGGEQQSGATGENIQGGVGTTTETGEKTASVGLFGGVKNLAASILGLSGSWLFWIILFLILLIILFLIKRRKKENN